MNTVTATTATRNRNKFATVHARLRILGIDNESEVRNLYVAITGVRSLRAMTAGQRRNLEQWLYQQINAAQKNTPVTSSTNPVSDDAAQALLD